MQVENGQETDPTLTDATVDTQTQPQTPPVKANEEDGHGGDQNDSSKTNPEPRTGETQTPPADDLAAKREEGKLQQVQKELQEAKEREKKYQEDVQRLKTIEEKAMETPDNYKQALKMVNGLSEEEANQEVAKLKAQGAWQQQQSQQQTQQPVQGAPAQSQVDPYLLAQEAARVELRQSEVRKQLFERVPQLNPLNIPPEKRPAMIPFATALSARAQQIAKNDPSKTDEVENLVTAYKEYTGKTDEEIQKVKEDSYRQGFIDSNSTNAAASGPARGITNTEGDLGLSPDQVKEANAEGIKLEEYAKLSSREVTVA